MWNPRELPRELGALLVWRGRLAEVVQPATDGDTVWVEIIDEGGISHTYRLPPFADFQPLQHAGECVLDAIRRVAARELSSLELRRRKAELWLAAPQVGDEFVVEQGYLLELTEIWDNGVIIALEKPHRPHYPVKVTREISFDSDRELRQFLRRGPLPLYRAAAHASLRAPAPAGELAGPPGE